MRRNLETRAARKSRVQWKQLVSAPLIALMAALITAAVVNSKPRRDGIALVQQCAAEVLAGSHAPTPPGTVNRVECNGRVFEDKIQYKLRRLQDGEKSNDGSPIFFEISTDIDLDVRKRHEGDGLVDPENAESDAIKKQVLADTISCMPVFNHYWNRFGIDLNFNIKLGKYDADSSNTLMIINQKGRSDSRHFYYQGLSGEMPLPGVPGIKIAAGAGENYLRLCKLAKIESKSGECEERSRRAEYCEMALHEIGHRLGLPDEYQDDATCPERTAQGKVSKEQNPWSIMAVPMVAAVDSWSVLMMLGIDPAQLKAATSVTGLLDSLGLEASQSLPPELAAILDSGADLGRAEFFPRHIKRVLAPLCPGLVAPEIGDPAPAEMAIADDLESDDPAPAKPKSE